MREEEGKKEKRRDRKGVALAPRKKFPRAPTLHFISKWFMESFSSKWVVWPSSEFHCVYIQYFSYKNFSLKVKTTKLYLASCPTNNHGCQQGQGQKSQGQRSRLRSNSIVMACNCSLVQNSINPQQISKQSGTLPSFYYHIKCNYTVIHCA